MKERGVGWTREHERVGGGGMEETGRRGVGGWKREDERGGGMGNGRGRVKGGGMEEGG